MQDSKSQIHTSNIVAHVFRLVPGQDLYVELKEYLKVNNINSAFILTCVGSLQKINIRTATGNEYIKLERKI